MVHTVSLKTRFLALFVVAFVCLNAGGAFCVAYCQTSDGAVGETEHCPLKRVSEHCDKTASGSASDAVTINGDEIDCCPMTVGLVAAPVETTVKFPTIVLTAVAATPAVPFRPVGLLSFSSTFDYRGPPPLDRRVERIKHRLLLI